MGVARFYLESEDLLLVTTDTDLYLIGSDTGLQVGRQTSRSSCDRIHEGRRVHHLRDRQGTTDLAQHPGGLELKANGLDTGSCWRNGGTERAPLPSTAGSGSSTPTPRSESGRSSSMRASSTVPQ